MNQVNYYKECVRTSTIAGMRQVDNMRTRSACGPTQVGTSSSHSVNVVFVVAACVNLDVLIAFSALFSQRVVCLCFCRSCMRQSPRPTSFGGRRIKFGRLLTTVSKSMLHFKTTEQNMV